MTTQESERLATLEAELDACPCGTAMEIMGSSKLEELLQLLIKKHSTN